MDIQSKIQYLTNRNLEHHKMTGRGRSNLHMDDDLVDLSNLKDIRPSSRTGTKVGGAWYDDLDDTLQTSAHIAHQFLPMMGLGHDMSDSKKTHKKVKFIWR